MAGMLSSYSPPASAQSQAFSDYVKACKSGLGNISSIPQFSCKSDQFRYPAGNVDGLNFRQSTDFVAHRQINSSVDVVYACRWVGTGGDTRAASGEMIVHNRYNGATCFFEQNDIADNPAYPQVDVSPISPTDGNSGTVWHQGIACTSCHAAGPYVASPEIVGALAKYGLINDKHDTWNGVYYPVGWGTAAPVVTQPACAAACHTTGGDPPVDSNVGAGLVFGAVVMPSINYIKDEVVNYGYMPPNDPDSDYRWVNRDSPTGTSDHEGLEDVQQDYPQFACDNPVALEAHVVDSDERITTDVPDKFNYFNLQDGLVCLHSDQPDGHRCQNYQTRYMCNGKFTAFKDLDSPTGSGDWETRSAFKPPCDNPTWIQARYNDGSRWIYLNGPADRLRRFDTTGLVCVNADQNNGKCSNYVVRFRCQ